jgi:hypothetical protein
MDRTDYIKITGVSKQEKMVLGARAKLAGQSMSKYLIESILMGEQFREDRVKQQRKAKHQHKAAAGKVKP